MPDTTISKDDLNIVKNEILMAEKIVEDKLLPQMRNAIQRYTSNHIPDIAKDWDIVLNEVYPIIQYELPAIFFRNPRVFLKPRNKTFIAKVTNPLTGEKEETTLDSTKSAHTQEALLNYTLSEIRYKEEVRKVLMDALLFKHGVLWHGYKGNFGMTDEQSLFIQDEHLFVSRIAPSKFLFDPSVTLSSIDEGRWIARSFDIPLRDIQEDDQLDVDKKLKGRPGYGGILDIDRPKPPMGNGGYDTMALSSRTRTLLDYTDNEYRQGVASRFVRVYEIFQRPSKKERRAGENGKIILFTPEQERPLRVSKWPYKAEGWPAKVLQFNYVPDGIFGLSDIEVYGEIADHKNVVINLQLRNAQENSKVWVGLSKDGIAGEEDVQRIKEGEQTIVFFEGDPRTKMTVASPGGTASSELYLLDTRIQANLDEKSGITDLKKGFLRSGEESATSVKIRNAGSSSRPAYRQDLMADFLKDSCLYLNDLNKQFLPYEEAVRIIGSLDIQWSENPTKEEIQADVDAELDVISMLPEDPEREVQELTTVLNLMTEALNNPALFQKLQQEGKTFNLSPIIENLLLRLKIRDPEVFRGIKPEENQGFASISELRAAEANVQAALTGNPPPSPPQEGQDHRTRLEVYGAIRKIFEAEGRISEILEQLIVMQQALLEAQEEKENPQAGKPLNLKKPFVKAAGAA